MRPVMRRVALAGHRTAIWHLPELRWAGVILCNSASALPDVQMEKLVDLYFPRDSLYPRDQVVEVVPYTPAGYGSNIPADIVGEYWSDELLTTWTIARRDSSYVLRRGTVPEVALRIGPDGAVMIGGWRVVVERDSSGVIRELVVGAGRSSGVRFGRRGP